MALRIVVNVSDEDQIALENDLKDVNEWVQNAVKGKINSCAKRMTREAINVLRADPRVATMPAGDKELRDELKRRPEYKNRSERES